jgi:hypothetical protein
VGVLPEQGRQSEKVSVKPMRLLDYLNCAISMGQSLEMGHSSRMFLDSKSMHPYRPDTLASEGTVASLATDNYEMFQKQGTNPKDRLCNYLCTLRMFLDKSA